MGGIQEIACKSVCSQVPRPGCAPRRDAAGGQDAAGGREAGPGAVWSATMPGPGTSSSTPARMAGSTVSRSPCSTRRRTGAPIPYGQARRLSSPSRTRAMVTARVSASAGTRQITSSVAFRWRACAAAWRSAGADSASSSTMTATRRQAECCCAGLWVLRGLPSPPGSPSPPSPPGSPSPPSPPSPPGSLVSSSSLGWPGPVGWPGPLGALAIRPAAADRPMGAADCPMGAADRRWLRSPVGPAVLLALPMKIMVTVSAAVYLLPVPRLPLTGEYSQRTAGPCGQDLCLPARSTWTGPLTRLLGRKGGICTAGIRSPPIRSRVPEPRPRWGWLAAGRPDPSDSTARTSTARPGRPPSPG